MRIPEGYEKSPVEVMSNFDREINQEVADKLKENNLFAGYPGWGFYAKVWWDKKETVWCCEVMTYGSYREIIKAEELSDIMESVSDKYGRE